MKQIVISLILSVLVTISIAQNDLIMATSITKKSPKQLVCQSFLDKYDNIYLRTYSRNYNGIIKLNKNLEKEFELDIDELSDWSIPKANIIGYELLNEQFICLSNFAMQGAKKSFNIEASILDLKGNLVKKNISILKAKDEKALPKVIPIDKYSLNRIETGYKISHSSKTVLGYLKSSNQKATEINMYIGTYNVVTGNHYQFNYSRILSESDKKQKTGISLVDIQQSDKYIYLLFEEKKDVSNEGLKDEKYFPIYKLIRCSIDGTEQKEIELDFDDYSGAVSPKIFVDSQEEVLIGMGHIKSTLNRYLLKGVKYVKIDGNDLSPSSSKTYDFSEIFLNTFLKTIGSYLLHKEGYIHSKNLKLLEVHDSETMLTLIFEEQNEKKVDHNMSTYERNNILICGIDKKMDTAAFHFICKKQFTSLKNAHNAGYFLYKMKKEFSLVYNDKKKNFLDFINGEFKAYHNHDWDESVNVKDDLKNDLTNSSKSILLEDRKLNTKLTPRLYQQYSDGSVFCIGDSETHYFLGKLKPFE